MANRDDRKVDELELKGEGRANAEVQISPSFLGQGDNLHLGDDDIVPGTNTRVSNLGTDGDAPGGAGKVQTLRAAEASPEAVVQAESLPRVPDADPVAEDITLDVLDGTEEGYRAIHYLNVTNIDNVVKGPGFVFTAYGIYRDFSNLDRIYAAEAGTIVPRGLYLIADRDLQNEPFRSRAVGRKVRTLEEAGFIPSLGTPTVETVPFASRVDSNGRPISQPTDVKNEVQ